MVVRVAYFNGEWVADLKMPYTPGAMKSEGQKQERRIRAYSQREQQNRDGSEPWPPAHCANGVTQILPHGFHASESEQFRRHCNWLC